ncbi:DsbA family protein [Streptomyces werraensis]|nr:DsbA family protein [Streptomyces werraensis]
MTVWGDGSKRAVNALRAALEVGKFVEYHEVLFRNQIEVESSGGFTTSTLLKLADEVSGLRSDSFDQAVKTMKYENFVRASQEAYDSANGDEPLGPGTPTVVINDKQVEITGLLLEEDLFEELGLRPKASEPPRCAWGLRPARVSAGRMLRILTHPPCCARWMTFRPLRSRDCGACSPERWLPLRSSHWRRSAPGAARYAVPSTGLRPEQQQEGGQECWSG